MQKNTSGFALKMEKWKQDIYVLLVELKNPFTGVPYNK